MTGFDFVILAILGVSGVLGLVRGLLREVLSLVGYAVAFVAAVWWGPTVTGWLTPYLDNSLLRMAAAYAAVFIVVLLGVGIVNLLVSKLIQSTGLSPADHGLGALFGLARGTLIILILVTLAGYTPMPQQIWWRNAMFSGAIVSALIKVKTMLPENLGTLIPYPQHPTDGTETRDRPTASPTQDPVSSSVENVVTATKLLERVNPNGLSKPN